VRVQRQSACRARGFSLVEALVVLVIATVLVTAALFQVKTALRSSSADAALATTLTQMRNAHQRAIDERTIFRLTFIPGGGGSTILLEEQQKNPGGSSTYQTVSNIALPTDMQFLNAPGIPTSATPDGFGDGSAAINFAINAGGDPTQIYFQPDGRALTQTGEVANGVVYIARPGDLLSSRSVSMYGATGRCKSWRLISLSDGSTAWSS
jgi:prepilin-type N-terminal cleavage/methylation domain-containing protein